MHLRHSIIGRYERSSGRGALWEGRSWGGGGKGGVGVWCGNGWMVVEKRRRMRKVVEGVGRG